MSISEKKKAVVLLSGGIDSATTLAKAKQDGYELYALTIDYGQRHRIELKAANRIAEHIGVIKQTEFTMNLRQFGGSALTDNIPVPKDRSSKDEIPVTYVPARNTIFLSLALGYAESIGAVDIFIGANAIDYSGYPDCRPNFLTAFENLANLATKIALEEGKIRIHAPLVELSKANIIKLGTKLGVDFALTISCYDPP